MQPVNRTSQQANTITVSETLALGAIKYLINYIA